MAVGFLRRPDSTRLTDRDHRMMQPMTKIMLTLAVLATEASAQSRTRSYYDSSGKSVGRSSTDSRGTTTFYDAAGKVTGRASTSGNKATIYDPAGRNVGRFTTNR
jgi:YD repeat-containing protein